MGELQHLKEGWGKDHFHEELSRVVREVGGKPEGVTREKGRGHCQRRNLCLHPAALCLPGL